MAVSKIIAQQSFLKDPMCCCKQLIVSQSKCNPKQRLCFATCCVTTKGETRGKAFIKAHKNKLISLKFYKLISVSAVFFSKTANTN